MKQIAFITGGTRGVGFEIVKKFVDRDIFTIFTGRNIETIKKIKDSFPKKNVMGMELDLTDLESVEHINNKLNFLKIRPNIIVHNAGYLSTSPIETPSRLEKLFLCNAISPILLTQSMIPHIDKGHIFFFSPPSKIDDKVKYLTPYLQSKYSQTTYMKSLSHILKEKDISVNSIWTDYPLWTDAIRKRNIGNQNDCAHPSIIADMILEVMDKEDPKVFKGNELIDRKYLSKKNIVLNKYFYEKKHTKKLDNLFLSHLTKK